MIQCDNKTSVTVLNMGRTHNSFLQGCLRELELVAAKHEFEIRAVHIKGVDNCIPDVLSRWEMGETQATFCRIAGRHGRNRPINLCIMDFLNLCMIDSVVKQISGCRQGAEELETQPGKVQASHLCYRNIEEPADPMDKFCAILHVF